VRWLHDARVMVRVHSWLTISWWILALGTTILALLYPDNRFLLAWVIFMSGYANAATHWSAKQAAEAEDTEVEVGGDTKRPHETVG
jgi:hypothetical protein